MTAADVASSAGMKVNIVIILSSLSISSSSCVCVLSVQYVCVDFGCFSRAEQAGILHWRRPRGVEGRRHRIRIFSKREG